MMRRFGTAFGAVAVSMMLVVGFMVMVGCNNNNDDENGDVPVQPVGSPMNVIATATSPSSITISWSPVSGATGYHIYRSTLPSDNYTHINTSATRHLYDNRSRQKWL